MKHNNQTNEHMRSMGPRTDVTQRDGYEVLPKR